MVKGYALASRDHTLLSLSALVLLLMISCTSINSDTGSQSDSFADNLNSDVELRNNSEDARTGYEIMAPELTGIAGWINSDPFTLEKLRGKVVLIDVWTYTCVNCIRTLPYLRDWHSKYAESGLAVIGLHSPEFEFEKHESNVISATLNYDLKYPILLDNDMDTWRALNNQFWPAKYLIDGDGYIRYTHFGEGDYLETELQIRALLEESGVSVSSIEPNLESERTIDPLARMSNDIMKRQTRELYAGFDRNYVTLQQGGAPYVMHVEYYSEPNIDIDYQSPREYLNHHIYVQGLWRNTSESLKHARYTENYEDYLAINFFARTVNVVMGFENKSYDVKVTMNGSPVSKSHSGEDVWHDEDGNSFVTVSSADMYRLINLPEFEGHELKISSNSSEFEVFAYTFGSYLD